ncbi:MAG: metal-dependent transcriptional regulator [Gemmatimonadota bacterium]|jgi:DtxR family Mn-dependent transcriptional regulator|nr:metal-dependent transcriptional regulator [Gemmatimonadota bacterium]
MEAKIRTQAVEDYLKVIYELGRNGEPVATSAISTRLGVAAATATGMIKKLATLNLVEHEHYRGVRLTTSGRKIALEVIRHHRLVERYLYEAMGVPWDQVHAEAEKWEHVLSEEMEDRMATILGDPTTDPHGSPIPTRELEVEERNHQPLSTLVVGQRATVAEVEDEDAAMLRHFAELGLFPGTDVEVTAVGPFGGPIILRASGRENGIGRQAADHVFVMNVMNVPEMDQGQTGC